MERDAHADARAVAPRLLAKRPLRVERGGERVRWAGERRDHAVALALLLGTDTAVELDGGARSS